MNDLSQNNQEKPNETVGNIEETKLQISPTNPHNKASPLENLTVPVPQPYINKLVTAVKSILKENEKIDIKNLFQICISLMQIAETFPNASGAYKKEVVISALSKFIQESGGDPTLITSIPPFIDMIISTEKGEITIQQVGQVATHCCIGICSTLANKQ